MEVTDAVQVKVKLSKNRVALDTILSSGLYMYYWFYLTWKQLKEETGRHHQPVGHALALLIPIYAWVIIHRHLTTIRELQHKVDLGNPLNPGQLLTLVIVANIIMIIGIRLGTTIGLILDIIGVVLLAAFFAQTQGHLNRYWEHTKGNQLKSAKIGVGEVIFTAIGIGIWVAYYYDMAFPLY